MSAPSDPPTEAELALWESQIRSAKLLDDKPSRAPVEWEPLPDPPVVGHFLSADGTAAACSPEGAKAAGRCERCGLDPHRQCFRPDCPQPAPMG